jgi:hypothetical protein
MCLGIILAVGFFIFLVYLVISSEKGREGFTISEYTKPLCNPNDFVGVDPNLTPDSIVLVVGGYNYQEPSDIYRDHKKIVPLQTWEDYTNMVYYYVVYAPRGLEGSRWEVHTTDLVKPTVNQGRVETDRPLDTSYIGIDDDGRYIWLISKM